MIDLDADDYQLLIRILHRYLSTGKVYAFGSRITGTHQKFSDLDLLVVASHPVPSDCMENLREAFSASSLPISIDVVDIHQVSEGFKKTLETIEKELITVIE